MGALESFRITRNTRAYQMEPGADSFDEMHHVAVEPFLN